MIDAIGNTATSSIYRTLLMCGEMDKDTLTRKTAYSRRSVGWALQKLNQEKKLVRRMAPRDGGVVLYKVVG